MRWKKDEHYLMPNREGDPECPQCHKHADVFGTLKHDGSMMLTCTNCGLTAHASATYIQRLQEEMEHEPED